MAEIVKETLNTARVGYVAAVIACLAFGSFAVPMKSVRTRQVPVDPLVMQTYKTLMCFATSWIVLLFGEKFSFTPWGLLSGLFWVPGGTAGIYAVRSPLGLAMSQSIWSPLKLMVGFIWGILVFHEKVRSQITALGAVGLMICGLCGMSYSAAKSSTRLVAVVPNHHETVPSAETYSCYDAKSPSSDFLVDNELSEPLLLSCCEDIGNETQHGIDQNAAEDDTQLLPTSEAEFPSRDNQQQPCRNESRDSLSLGYLCAIIDGVYGGSILVPMHFARETSEGLGFVTSFAVGALVVLSIMWILRFFYNCLQTRSISLAYRTLPGFHFPTLWLPGGLAGLLWSIGNVSAIVCVANLGEGVGYCIVQAQMLVAGLWGILYYRELLGAKAILCWLCFALVTITGVLLLSHEHVQRPKDFGI